MRGISRRKYYTYLSLANAVAPAEVSRNCLINSNDFNTTHFIHYTVKVLIKVEGNPITRVAMRAEKLIVCSRIYTYINARIKLRVCRLKIVDSKGYFVYLRDLGYYHIALLLLPNARVLIREFYRAPIRQMTACDGSHPILNMDNGLGEISVRFS